MSGNTPKIALKHCLQVTAEDFQQAAEFERPDGSAESSALLTEMHHLDPQLQLLIEAWPTLSKALQQQVMLLLG